MPTKQREEGTKLYISLEHVHSTDEYNLQTAASTLLSQWNKKMIVIQSFWFKRWNINWQAQKEKNVLNNY